MTNRNATILAFLVFVLVLFATAELEANNAASSQHVSCCDSVQHPSSCWPTTNPAELGPCDPAAELGDCEVLDGVVNACKPIELQCCSPSAGVVWLDACEPHEPGDSCSGVVVGAHAP